MKHEKRRNDLVPNERNSALEIVAEPHLIDLAVRIEPSMPRPLKPAAGALRSEVAVRAW